MLASHHALQVVYEYRQRLQALWLERSAREDSLLAALQEWCHEAEATGIAALQEFARSLRRYTLATA
jgi:stearoyl-CoA desaturase (delta-9 desaturase)